jgi:hypothetical protein
MPRLFDLIGRCLFPRQPGWEQRKNARTLAITLAFALTLGLVLVQVICLIYRHR